MGARRARAHAFVLRVRGGKAGGVERQDDSGQGHPRRPQDQMRAAAPLVVRLRDYTGYHLGPVLHREHLPSVTRNVTSDQPIPIFTDFLERRQDEVRRMRLLGTWTKLFRRYRTRRNPGSSLRGSMPEDSPTPTAVPYNHL